MYYNIIIYKKNTINLMKKKLYNNKNRIIWKKHLYDFFKILNENENFINLLYNSICDYININKKKKLTIWYLGEIIKDVLNQPSNDIKPKNIYNYSKLSDDFMLYLLNELDKIAYKHRTCCLF
jgi:hypothetical protein